MSEDEALFTELRQSKGLIEHEGYDASDIDDAIELITKLRGQIADAEKNIAQMEHDDSLREEGDRWAGL